MIEMLKTRKSIICLDGNLPCDLVRKLDLPIVAADRAANALIKNGIEPDVIIGDLDSVDETLLRDRPHIKIDDQDSTDFEKALEYVEKKSLTPTIVTGIDGGCIDHALGNVSIFSRTNCVAVFENMILVTIDEDKTLNVPIGAKISIFGIPRCLITSRGLKWELDDYEAAIDGKNSISNRAVSSQIELKVSSGKAIVFVYTKNVSDAGSL
ncbi:MAG: thiamine diphosphokinase [Holosporaceae bacterium]|jgi:thiamine pyrophosphokinase|nr:thiamine diphosphokinase [Holosporaceae bacterium]